MLLLTSVNDNVQSRTGTAANVHVHASWVDNNAGVITPGRQDTTIATATTSTIVPAPTSGIQRNVKSIIVLNNDAANTTTFTLEHNDGTNNIVLSRVTLLPYEGLNFTDNGELLYHDAQGALKLPTTKLDVCLRVTADSVHATAATWATVTGLSTAVKANTRYSFDCCLFHITNATTTGAQFGIGGVAMTAMIAGAISTVTNSATAATMSTGVATAVDTATVVQTTGSAANAPTYMSGMFQPSADGTFAVRATSEVTVASGLIVRAGSWLRIREFDN